MNDKAPISEKINALGEFLSLLIYKASFKSKLDYYTERKKSQSKVATKPSEHDFSKHPHADKGYIAYRK